MKTAFSATPPFFLRMFLVWKKGKKEALRAEKACSFAPEGGMVGEKRSKIFCKKIRIFIVLFEKQF